MEVDAEQKSSDVELWFHVSSLSWNPYLPNIRRLTVCDSDDEGEASEITLQATHNYYNTWQAASALQSFGTDSWQWSCYELLDSSRPLVELQPLKVRVSLAEDIGESSMFSCASSTKRRRTARDGWSHALDEVDDVGSDDDDGDVLLHVLMKDMIMAKKIMGRTRMPTR